MSKNFFSKLLSFTFVSLILIGCQIDSTIQNASIENSELEQTLAKEIQKTQWEIYIFVNDGNGERDIHKFKVYEVGEGLFDSGYSKLNCHSSGAVFATQMEGMCYGDPCNAIQCVDEYVTYDIIPCYGNQKLRFTLNNDTGTPDVNADYNTSTREFSNLTVKNSSTASIIDIIPEACEE